MSYSCYCLAWLGRSRDVVSDLHKKVKSHKVLSARTRRSFIGDLKHLINNIPVEVLMDSICTVRCGPHVTVLMDAIYEVESGVDGGWFIDQNSFEKLLDKIIEKFEDKGFKYSLLKIRRAQEISSASVYEYVTGLKAAYSKICVVRLDFHFPWDVDGDFQFGAAELDAAESIVAFVKKTYESWLGHVMKFEFGAERGIHLHTVFIFNGSKVNNDVEIGRRIGEHWRLQIQKGGSGYFNCNTREYQKGMKWPAMGSFTEANEAFEKGMKHLADYLTQSDPIVRMALPRVCKTLRRTKLTMKERKSQVRRALLKARRAGDAGGA